MNDRPADQEKPPAAETAAVAGWRASSSVRAAANAPDGSASPSGCSSCFWSRASSLSSRNEWDWWVGIGRPANHRRRLSARRSDPARRQGSGLCPPTSPCADFQKVKAGDLLVQIVDDDYRAELEQAEANVAAAQAAIQTIEQQKLLQAALIEQARGDDRGEPRRM